MKKKLLLLAMIGVVFIVTGCAYYSLVESGSRVDVGQGLWVESNIDWSKAKQRGAVVWTVNGPGLEQIVFFPGIKDGKPLFQPKAGNDSKNMPLYTSGMTFLEVMDLLEATMARENVHQFKKENMHPATLGGEEGFRFDFSYVSEGGLDYKGTAAGAVRDEKLYLVMYTGTSLHYYDKYSKEVEHIINSIEFL